MKIRFNYRENLDRDSISFFNFKLNLQFFLELTSIKENKKYLYHTKTKKRYLNLGSNFGYPFWIYVKILEVIYYYYIIQKNVLLLLCFVIGHNYSFYDCEFRYFCF